MFPFFASSSRRRPLAALLSALALSNLAIAPPLLAAPVAAAKAPAGPKPSPAPSAAVARPGTPATPLPAIEPSAPVLVLAPAPSGPDVAGWLGDAAVAGVSAGALLGLAMWDGGEGPLSRLGPLGQLSLLGAVVAVPPVVLVQWHEGGFSLDGALAALTGGLAGLGLGYAVTRSLGGQTPTPSDRAIQAAAMALGQGLGASTGYRLYRAYQPFDPEWDRLPEHRTDDPIENWNLQRERKQP